MPFTLDSIVPWGRSMDEYAAMFALSRQDLSSRILGCADGPASFNAEMHGLGRRVVSADPLYQFSAKAIRARIDQTYPTMVEQLHENRDDFVWTSIASPEQLGQRRRAAMDRFLADFPRGKPSGRYVACELPELPFGDGAFDLAVCSHFLFLYSDQLSAEFHRRATEEMLRVARQVRIFPLLTLGREPSPHFNAVCEHFRQAGRICTIETVQYEFQRGGNRMLRIR